MTDIWAIVPVKTFSLAKQRLGEACPPALRRRLAQTMLEDVLDALGRVQALAGIAVVTPARDVAQVARRHGAEVVEEPPGGGLNGAVASAAARLVAAGRGGMLVVASDVPGITAAEIDAVLASHGRGRAVSLVPAHDLGGTNAILATPPDIMTPAFGPGSFARHRDDITALGIVPTVAMLPGIGLDIDTPRDIERFMRTQSPTRTWQLLDDHRSYQRSPFDRFIAGALHHAS